MDPYLCSLIGQLEQEHTLSASQWIQLLNGRTPELAAYLFEKSRRAQIRFYGHTVYIRGLIEFTNYCKILLLLRDPQRQHTCTSLSADKRGYPRLLCGWVQTWISYLCPARRRRSMVYNGSIIRPGPHNPHHVPGLCHHTFYRRSN